MSVNCTPLELLGHRTSGLLNSVPNVAGEGRKGDMERWKEEEERERDKNREKVHRETEMDRQIQTKTSTETQTVGVRD